MKKFNINIFNLITNQISDYIIYLDKILFGKIKIRIGIFKFMVRV